MSTYKTSRALRQEIVATEGGVVRGTSKRGMKRDRNTPVVTPANQTMEFGRLTAAGFGGATLQSFGSAINGPNSFSGTNADHFTISSSGEVTPTAAFVANPQASYALVATIYNITGYVTSNVAITTIANARSFKSDAEFAAIMALGVAVLSGTYMYGRNVGITNATSALAALKNKTYSPDLTIKSHDNSNPVIFTRFSVNNVKGLVVDGAKVAQAPSGASLVNVVGPSIFIIKNSEICTIPEVDSSADFSQGWYSNLNGINCGNSGGWPIDLTVENCRIHDVYVGINANTTNNITISKNIVQRCYSDTCKIGGNAARTTGIVRINGNVFFDLFGKGTDVGNPHPDFLQFIGGSFNWTNIFVTANIFATGPGRGSGQVIFADDSTAGFFFTMEIDGNLCIGEYVRGISVSRAKNCKVRSNTVAMGPPTTTNQKSILIGGTESNGVHEVYDNVAEAISVAGSPLMAGNVILGQNGVTIPYLTAFVGPDFAPEIYSQIVSMYAIAPGGPLDTPSPKVGATAGYSNFTEGTWSNPR